MGYMIADIALQRIIYGGHLRTKAQLSLQEYWIELLSKQ